jgi:hypothetical protein
MRRLIRAACRHPQQRVTDLNLPSRACDDQK